MCPDFLCAHPLICLDFVRFCALPSRRCWCRCPPFLAYNHFLWCVPHNFCFAVCGPVWFVVDYMVSCNCKLTRKKQIYNTKRLVAMYMFSFRLILILLIWYHLSKFLALKFLVPLLPIAEVPSLRWGLMGTQRLVMDLSRPIKSVWWEGLISALILPFIKNNQTTTRELLSFVPSGLDFPVLLSPSFALQRAPLREKKTPTFALEITWQLYGKYIIGHEICVRKQTTFWVIFTSSIKRETVNKNIKFLYENRSIKIISSLSSLLRRHVQFNFSRTKTN